MAELEVVVPVFLPGADGTREVAGRATVHEDGRIEINMATESNVERVVKMLSDVQIMSISFDYRPIIPDLETRKITSTIIPYLDN